MATATCPTSQLEGAADHYIWQPESLMYTDIQTGHEVWILTFGPGGEEIYSKEHGTNAWSADGSRIGIFSMWRPTANPALGSYHWRWVVNTDGSKLRACEGYGRQDRPHEGFGWSHSENAYYAFGSRADEATGSQVYKLFKNNLDASNVVTGTLLLDTSAVDTAKKEPIKEGITSLDHWIVARGGTFTGTTPNPITCSGLYFIRLAPTPSVYNYWGIARRCGPAGDPYGDHEWPMETKFHDMVSPGPEVPYTYGTYSGTATLWAFKKTGSYSDGGPVWEDWDGDSFGEREEIKCVSDGAGTPDNPYGMPYFGHPAFDRWGRYAVMGTYTDSPHPGTRIWDSSTITLLPHYVLAYYKYDGQHHSWTGWSDYVIGVMPDWPPGYEKAYYIYANRYYENYDKAIEVVDTHYGDYPPASYNAYPRPSQSPDGTKVAFAQYFLHGTNQPYIAWAVVHYPYSPTDLSAIYQNGVKLSWLPPRYTNRGWPNEEKDPAPYAREIKSYHIWRSTSQSGSWNEIATVKANYYVDDYYGLRPNLDELYYIDNPADGTYYYALTSEEHSKLESQELSEILEVTVSGTNISSRIVAPKGQKDFWRKTPPAPSNFTYQATGTPGHYQLTWTEPNDSKIRYYNIYYSIQGIPDAIQQNRIASVPVGTSKYLDWLADPNNPGYYRITSVDKYGNEGATPLQGLLGDVNSDGKVDIKDLIMVAKDFGKTSGFNPNCDLNGDARVDIRDLIIVAKNFGRTG